MMQTSLEERVRALGVAWSLTQEMLLAARQGDWEGVAELQDRRQTVLEVIESSSTPFLPDEIAFIHKILQASPELESLTLVQRNEVSRLIKEATTGRSMAQTYAGNSGGE
jgi:dihydrodipicolinate synthase/N-acetylneuraminate lyase